MLDSLTHSPAARCHNTNDGASVLAADISMTAWLIQPRCQITSHDAVTTLTYCCTTSKPATGSSSSSCSPRVLQLQCYCVLPAKCSKTPPHVGDVSLSGMQVPLFPVKTAYICFFLSCENMRVVYRMDELHLLFFALVSSEALPPSTGFRLKSLLTKYKNYPLCCNCN